MTVDEQMLDAVQNLQGELEAYYFALFYFIFRITHTCAYTINIIGIADGKNLI